MADIFYDAASGNDANDGSTRALAKATLAAALTAAGVGGRVGAKSDSAETLTAAVTLTSPGTAASPVQILSIDWTSDTLASNALAAGASFTTQAGGAARNITFAGFAYVYGVTFQAGTGANQADLLFTSLSAWYWNLDSCSLKIGSTSSASRITIGNVGRGTTDDQRLELHGTPFSFGHASQTIALVGEFYWHATASGVAGTIPTTLITCTPGIGLAEIVGVDLSGMGSGNIFSVSAAGVFYLRMLNCKLGASAVLATGSIAGQGGAELDVVNCDSSDTNYRYHKQRYQGTITHETTIVRTSGASDGTTPISRKMVTTANSKFYGPLVSDPIIVWNEATGSSLTGTIEIVTDNVTLTDAEAWVEVEYLGTSGFPMSSFAHDRASNILSTPANQTTSSETWTTTGLATPVKQKLAVSFTPQEKGPVALRVYLAKASTTMYFCPKATIA